MKEVSISPKISKGELMRRLGAWKGKRLSRATKVKVEGLIDTLSEFLCPVIHYKTRGLARITKSSIELEKEPVFHSPKIAKSMAGCTHVVCFIATIGQGLEHLGNIFYIINVYPNDLPEQDVDVNRFAATLNHTQKHVMGGVYTVEGVRKVVLKARLIAGSEKNLRQRPFISMVTCSISPLKLDEHYAELTMEAARNHIPVVVPSEPLCGATALMTLAGNLVLQNVESLAGVMLAQITNPGTTTIYGSVSFITDLREMKYLSGAVGMGLLNAAAAELDEILDECAVPSSGEATYRGGEIVN